MIPQGWQIAEFGDIVSSISYGHTASASSKLVGPKFLRITDLQNGQVNWETVPYCACDDVEKYALKPGDIVVARTGATTGKSYLLVDPPDPSVFASYLIRLETSGLATPQYLAKFMESPDYWRQITVVSKGSAQPGANATVLSRLQIPLAPENEQRRIVAKIETLQERSRKARAALEAIPPLLEQFRQSVLAAAFRGDLTADWRAQHPDVEPASVLLDRIRADRRRRWEEAELTNSKAKRKPYGKENGQGENGLSVSGQEERLSPIPLMWEWASVGQVSYIDGGLTRNKSKRERGPTTAPLVTVAAVKLRAINPAEIGEITLLREDGDKGVLKTGDLLIVEGNGSLAHIGRVALWDGSVPEARHQNHLIRIRPLLLDPRFLLEWLASPLGREFIVAEATSAAGLYNLSISKIGRIHIPLPSLAEQIQILQCIKDRLSNLDDLEQEVVSAIERLDQLDQSILAKAFRGELVPQDPNDEPASVLLERIRAEREAQSAKPRAKKKTPGSTKHTKKAPPVSVNENDDLPLFNNLQK